MTIDKRQYASATTRNRDAIYNCLKDRLPKGGTLLEVASGTGEHAAYLAPLLQDIIWQPTIFDENQLASVEAWRAHVIAKNILPPLRLDAASLHWPIEEKNYIHSPISAIFNANMVHISPWSVCEGLFAGARRTLTTGGKIFLYGPFKINGEQTAPSNVEFEQWLKNQNTAFGVRDLTDIIAEAEKNGLSHLESCPMPANNFIQVFVKS